ncbi:MAG: hypothetical protein ACYC8T_16805 [Myxococcaceae bacterium]
MTRALALIVGLAFAPALAAAPQAETRDPSTQGVKAIRKTVKPAVKFKAKPALAPKARSKEELAPAPPDPANALRLFAKLFADHRSGR